MHACIDREDAVLAMMILVSAGGMLAVLYCEKEPQSHSDVTPMLICRVSIQWAIGITRI